MARFTRLLLVIGMPLAWFGIPAVASATTCSMASHCYNIVDWESGSYGGSTSLYVPPSGDPIRTPPALYQTDFVNQELWVGTSNDTDHQYWVEAGVKAGYSFFAGSSVNMRFFWEDSRPSGGIYGHVVTTIGNVWDYSSSWVPVSIWASSSTHYTVQINNSIVGDSYVSTSPSRWMQSGLETTSASNVAHTGTGPLRWLSYGGWTNYWSYAGVPSTLYSSGVGSIYWSYTNIVAVDNLN